MSEVFSSEEIAAEKMAKSNREVASGGDAVMPELNIDPLPSEDMIIQGAEQGGLVDKRRRHWIIGACAVALAIVLGVTVSLVRHGSPTRGDAASPNLTPGQEESQGDELLVDEDTLENEQVMQNIPVSTSSFEDEDIVNNDLEVSREQLIMYKLQNISGDAVIQDGTPQHKASQWIMYNDDMTVDANEEPRFTQRYVLATMYYALSGESWNNSTGMLSSASECRWYGVDCAPLTHVIQKIKWGNNTLAGSIPSEIGLLENVGKS